MRRTDIKLFVPVALVIGLLIAIYSCSNPKDPVDSQPPTVAITNPAPGSRVGTAVDVTANAVDNTAVTKVEFYVDAQLYYTDNTPPWSCYWTMSEEQSGEHNLFAKAFDEAGNTDLSDLVTVTCENLPPSVISDLDTSGVDVYGNLTLTWTAPGEDGDVGTPVLYDIRYYWTALTADNWSSGTQLEDVPQPQEAGSAESFDVTGLHRGTTYFMAIRTQDSADNWSEVSNNVEATIPGLLADPVTYEINSLPNPRLIVTDLNDDTHLDLVLSHRLTSDNVTVMMGNGDGTFQSPPVSFSVFGSPSALCAADFNHDDSMDVLVSDWAIQGTIMTSMTLGLDTAIRFDDCFWMNEQVIFKKNDTTFAYNKSIVSMLWGVDGGSVEYTPDTVFDLSYTYCFNPACYVLGDTCNCTMWDTLVYATPDNILRDKCALDPDRMAADTVFVFPLYAYPYSCDACAADFTGDGWTDVVFANYQWTYASIMRNDGAGNLLPPDTVGLGIRGTFPIWVCSADLNGDTYEDILCANSGQDEIALLINNGDGTFATAREKGVGDNPLCITTGDFNGDGYIDFASANYGEGTVSVYYNLGDGTFPANASDYKAGWGPSGLVATDLTGDGTPELIVTNQNDDNLTVLVNEGLYRYYSDNSEYIPVGDGPTAIGCGDFDEDGDNDIVVVNRNDGTISILLNRVIE